MSGYPAIHLKKGRDVPVRAGHPWIFSNALANVDDNIGRGEVVLVVSANGTPIALGTYHPGNTIRVRIISHNTEDTIDASFFAARFTDLSLQKRRLIRLKTEAFRLVQSDADYLPGLIIDMYSRCLVFQIHTAGMELLKDRMLDGLEQAIGPEVIIERSDVEVRRQEYIEPLEPVVHKGECREPVSFTEGDIKLLARPMTGQKTGFYLDQRGGRKTARAYGMGRQVTDLFCYSGGTAVAALFGGAEKATCVDSSQTALELAQETFRINEIDPSAHRFVRADVFDFLGHGLEQSAPALIISDPPAFAKNRKSLDAGCKAYSRLSEMCFASLGQKDLLLTSSCSGLITREDFLSLVRHGAGRAGRTAAIVEELSQPADHTLNLAFPEGRYLKSLLLEITS